MERWADVPASSGLDPDLAWKVEVSPGCVNDALVTMLYRRQKDPRGWVMPVDWPAPRPGDADYDMNWLERPLLDAFDEAPFLYVVAPAVGATKPDAMGFAPVAARIPYFQQPDFANVDLFLAFVFLSADTGIATAWTSGVPPRLTRHRVFVGQRPNSNGTDGGWLEVARLWLARGRTNGSPDPKTDVIYVQQTLFWCVAATVAQPQLNVFPVMDGTDPVADLFQQLAEDAVNNALQEATSTGFWTV